MTVRQRFGKMLAEAGQLYWEVDQHYVVVFANELVKTVFGDPVGQTCHVFMTGSGHICEDCPVQKVFVGAERAVSERMRHDFQGKPIWLQHTATPIKDASGKITGASELSIDVTLRKQTEEWLKDSERLYRNLVEQVPDIIFSLDQSGKFSFVNTQVERLLGYPVRNILETPLKDYVAPDAEAKAETILRLGPYEIWDEDIAVIDAMGERKYARIRCKASFGDDGKLVGFEGVMRDRTSRKKLEEELKASKSALMEKIRIIDELYEHIVESGKSKAIEEHTAEVAHELRQPLAIVGGFARRLRKLVEGGQPVDLEKQTQYLGIIVSEITRLEKILDRLIDFTRRTNIVKKRVDPNELIDYIVRITEQRINEKQIVLSINLGHETGEVPVEPGRFQQLLLNLLSNAIDASPVGETIELETGVSIPSDKAAKSGELQFPGFFEVKIRNKGPVIPAEALQNVFNPFFTTKQHGTGLGLTVAKKIVEDHSGSISVKSDVNGTIFTIWLPLVEDESSGDTPATGMGIS